VPGAGTVGEPALHWTSRAPPTDRTEISQNVHLALIFILQTITFGGFYHSPELVPSAA